MFRKEIRSEIEIQALPETVWKILTVFGAFMEWNVFMRPVVGEALQGAKLRVQIRPPGKKAMALRPKVTKVVSNRELRWLGRFWIPGLLDGEHIFEIEPLGPDRVRFVQREVFCGLLVPFMEKRIEEQTLPGFWEMNRALKERAETGEDGSAGRLGWQNSEPWRVDVDQRSCEVMSEYPSHIQRFELRNPVCV